MTDDWIDRFVYVILGYGTVSILASIAIFYFNKDRDRDYKFDTNKDKLFWITVSYFVGLIWPIVVLSFVIKHFTIEIDEDNN